MFEIFTNTSQVLTENTAISFSNTKFEDCRINLSNDGKSITIKAPGCYLFHFDAIGSSNTVDSPVSIQLFVDGTAQPCAQTTVTTAVAEGENGLSFDTLLQVKPSCCCTSGAQTLQLVMTEAVAATITHANVVIIHL